MLSTLDTASGEPTQQISNSKLIAHSIFDALQALAGWGKIDATDWDESGDLSFFLSFFFFLYLVIF